MDMVQGESTTTMSSTKSHNQQDRIETCYGSHCIASKEEEEEEEGL
jgi:hypothetical protein